MDETPVFDDTLGDALKEIHDLFVEGTRKELNVPEDWRYFSDYCSLEAYEQFVEIVGKENIVFVSGSTRGDAIRFSIFVSPLGAANVREVAKAKGIIKE